MNFLQLVNRALQEAGSSLPALTTVASPTAGEASRFVGWVQDAWNEIQVMKYDWNFLRPWIQFTTTTNQQVYTPAAVMAIATNSVTGTPMSGNVLQQWVRRTFRCWITSQGTPSEQIQNFMDWDEFRNIYVYATQRTNYARPVIVSVDPAKSLWFGPIPDSASGPGDSYTISMEVWLQPQIIAGDNDIPIMPIPYHMLIVWKALEYYAGFESAPEVMARSQSGWNKLFPQLMIDQLPVMKSGPPMATDTRL
jgi:hypothetical protein